MRKATSFFILISTTLSLLSFPPAQAQTETIRDIAFPTDPNAVTFIDDFGEPRNGHAHEGIDMLGPKMTPLYAAVDGVVSYLVIPEASWGYAIVLQDDDGYTYHYLHVNNDTPGTNDGAGGVENAYAPGIARNANVTRGQLIGWMGDSGNAEDITSHLHFEIRKDDVPINPYASLVAASGGSSSVPTGAPPTSPDINTDKGLIASGDPAPCVSGALIKNTTYSAVYYCGANGKRYAFPHERVFFTWYDDFDDVQIISDAELAAVPLGGNVTYRPGVKMVKLESTPAVYAVYPGGELRWITAPSVAAKYYGVDWAKKVDDLSDAFFTNYSVGEPVYE